ncbi:MAG: cyclase family protein [Epulopiscium sp.]|nr:cyclase family protein [Candidatus Epulonipiscium sp.]
MKIYDISMEIHEEMTVYKNYEHKKPQIKMVSNFDTGTSYETDVTLNLHTGTHIDMPLHMIQGGSTLDTFDITKMITPCKVLDLTHVSGGITKKDLEKYEIKEDDFILLKTKNSDVEEFDFEFIYLEKTGASYLVEKRIKGVGIDALGIERAQPEYETHRQLLSQGVVILEGLRLKDIQEGDYFLYAVPLKIRGVEASPVRALLMEERKLQ